MTQDDMFSFRLYVAGDAPNSIEALANLRDICNRLLPQRHRIEVVDVFQNPKRALADGVFLTPALVKLAPAPVRRIIGSLNRTQTVVQALGLPAGAA